MPNTGYGKLVRRGNVKGVVHTIKKKSLIFQRKQERELEEPLWFRGHVL